MSHYYLFKEENLTEDQKQRLYDLTMELGPQNDVSYSEHIAEISADAIKSFAKALSNTVQIPSGPMTRADYYKAAIRHAIQFAGQYAAKVRQGGE